MKLKHYLLICLCLLAGIKALANFPYVVNGIYYDLYNISGQASVTYRDHNYNSYSGTVSIPSSFTYSGKTFRVIGIGNNAFRDCSGLKSVSIPNSVTSIGSSAFRNCSGLTSITIPASVTSIGGSAFDDCSSLTSVTINNNAIVSKSYSSSSTLSSIFGNQVKEYVFGNDVQSIGQYACYKCSNLTSVTIPNSVTSICNNAFDGCSHLTSITIPSSVTSIGSAAFYVCNALTYVIAERETPVTIDENTFSYRRYINLFVPKGCKAAYSTADRWKEFKTIQEMVPETDGLFYSLNKTSMKAQVIASPYGNKYEGDIVIPSSVTFDGETYSVTSIGTNAFHNCTGLTSISFPSSITSIDGFSGCTGLTSVTFPNSVTSISGFTGCTGLTSVTFPNSVTSIGWNAFLGCTGLTSISFPSSITSINGFSGCTGLTSVTFPNSVTSISGFSGCTGLTSVTFPNSVTSISGFSGCTNLSSISIPNSVTSIDSGSFGETAWYNSQPDGMVYIGKVALNYKGTMPEGTHITIKEGTTVIARGALSGEFNPQCRENLTSVSLPNSLTHIGDMAFGYSSSLTSINIPYGVTSIGNHAFQNCSGLTSITLPASVTSIGSAAFYYCSGLTSITIPASVTSFGGEIFGGCKFAFMIMESETPFFESIQEWYSTFATTIPILYVPAGCKDAYIAAFSAYGYDDWNRLVWSIKDKLPELVDGIYYDFDTENKVAEVAYPFNGEKYEGNIVIPSSVTYKGVSYSVTGISPAAFYKCDSLISVTIPESVTSIGTHAFYNCTGLFSVIVEREMPVTIYSKEDYLYDVFSGCWNATLYVPAGCREAYTAAEGWNVFKSIIEGAPDMVAGLYYKFDKANKVAEVTCSPYGDKYKGSISIPSSVAYNGETYSVTRIDSIAFRGCTDLTSVVIPNGVTNIEHYSFRGCSSLTSINIPNSVTSIGNGAFSGCTGLTSITIPNSVTSIGQNAFYQCSSLSTITIPENVTNVGYQAFWGTSWYEAQPDGLMYIGKAAYQYKGTVPEGAEIVIKEGTVSLTENLFNEKGYSDGLTSVTIPGSVTSIGNDAFGSYCPHLTNVKVGMETPLPIYWNTFSNRRNATLYVPVGCKATYADADYWKEFKQIIDETPQIAGLYYRFDKSKMVAEVIASPHGDKYQGNIVIPDSVILKGSTYTVTSIADSAFSQCTSLTSVTIPRYMTSISKSAFYGSYSSYGYNFKFYATRNTDGLIAVWNYGVDPYLLGGYPWETISRPYIKSSSLTQTSIKYRVVNVYDFEYETNGESLDSYTYQITGLRPEYSQLITLTVRSANNSYSTSTTLTTLPVTPVVNIENITASSFTAKGTCKFTGYIPDIISRKITVDGMEKDGDEMTFRGLDPNTSHTCKYKLVLEYPGNYRYSCEASKEITTAELSLVTKQPKTISEGNVIVAAETNVDDEEANVGFEWRRIDWTDDFDSKSGGAYLFEGMMEGYIRSVNSNYLWKFRPFYTSNAGNTYYGEWKGMDPSDYSYFEPTVHTYADINVTGNSAEVKGYAMRGTDNVTSQGFMYWENNSSFSLRRRVTTIPDNVTVVRASGNVMTATLEDLEYETSYSYVAFMTTSEGETFYGEVNTFTTDVDPDGVDEVKSQDAVTEIARYDVQGRPISKPQKGINIIRYSDGSTRKVMVK